MLAESDDTIEVEGNLYFPQGSVKTEYFRESGTHSTCPWKGEASYYDVVLLKEKPIKMLHGTIPNQRRRQNILKAMLLSGRAWKWKSDLETR